MQIIVNFGSSRHMGYGVMHSLSVCQSVCLCLSLSICLSLSALSLPYITDSLTNIPNTKRFDVLIYILIKIKIKNKSIWAKNNKVVPLLKSADKTNPINYRPISLLSDLSKLFKKQEHICLNDFLEKRQLPHPFSLDLDVNTPATLHWHVLQIIG